MLSVVMVNVIMLNVVPPRKIFGFELREQNVAWKVNQFGKTLFYLLILPPQNNIFVCTLKLETPRG